MSQSNQDIFESHRAFLTALAGRITGSWAEAQDLVSDAYLRWHTLDCGQVKNPKALLATMVSRLALNNRTSARSRHELLVEPDRVAQLTEVSGNHSAEVADALGDALEIVLSRLSPPERAVFLLREVFQFDYSEVAELLGEKEPNCRQILKRARDKITLREPRFHVAPENRELVLERFLAASRTGNFDDLMAAVAPDVLLVRDAGDLGLPQPAPMQGANALFEHMRRFLGKFRDLSWTSYPIGRGYEVAALRPPDCEAVSALICRVNAGTIERVDHVTCPARLKVFKQLFEIEL